jgi:predicted O-methyltransferase YrrM
MSSSFTGLIIATSIVSFFAILFLDLRRRRVSPAQIFRLPLLAGLDLLPPAVTVALAVALSASLLPIAAATGLLPIRSPALLALIFCCITLPLFWMEGRRQIQFQRPNGLLFAEWLIAFGALRILLAVAFSFAAARPSGQPPARGLILHSVLFALPSLIVGAALVIAVVPPFLKKYEGLRILERVGSDAQFLQPESTPPTPECPQPELWKMLDSQSTELEVLSFLTALVVTIKPKLILETGTFLGYGTLALAEGLRQNGFGKIITVEFDPDIRARALQRFADSGLAPFIESRLESSLDTVIDGTIDLFFSDSHLANREAEIRRLLPQLDPRGVLIIHDASSHFIVVRQAALRLEAEGLISAVLLSTPRGVVVAQRRAGRE